MNEAIHTPSVTYISKNVPQGLDGGHVITTCSADGIHESRSLLIVTGLAFLLGLLEVAFRGWRRSCSCHYWVLDQILLDQLEVILDKAHANNDLSSIQSDLDHPA